MTYTSATDTSATERFGRAHGPTPGRWARVGAVAAAAALAATGVLVTSPAAPVSAQDWTISDLTTSGVDADRLAAELAGEGVTIQNASFTGADTQGGLFGGPAPIGAINLFDGVVLSTGDVNDAPGPNTAGNTSTNQSGAGDPDLSDLVDGATTRDAAVLEIEFVPTDTDLQINYVFGSEEYQEFVDSSFNDVFGFFVNGENCATVATDAGTVPVSVNTINHLRSTQLYINNPNSGDGPPFDVEFDGFTRPLTCFAEVNPGEVNTLKLAIADTSDSIYDSAVFLEASGVTSTPKTRYQALETPQRIYDSRPIGQVPAGGQVTIPVAGLAGVPADAISVALNVTSTRSTASGFFTVWPTGDPRPNASNVNYVAGVDTPNLVVAKIGDDGSINVFAEQASDVVVDVFGWFDNTVAENGFTPTVPNRVVDTRSTPGKPAAGEIVTFQVTGGGVPEGVDSVALNLTINDADAAGWAAAFAAGDDVPATSNVNVLAGETRPNVVFAPVSDDGRVSVYLNVGAHVIADVLGSYNTESDAELFKPVRPRRVWDTRQNEILAAGGELTLKITDIVGVPSTATAVVLNVTAAAPEAPGFLTIYPADVSRPEASNLNYVTGQVVPNVVISGVSPAGEITIYSFATTHVIVDVAGWYG
ncbi:MAG: choice-of-anchor L domain-containing protein [Ilumatobacteraceae bacterium]